MRTVLLTTDTPHHRWFADAVRARHPWAGILVETEPARFPFETAHPFEEARDRHEREILLGGRAAAFGDAAPTSSFPRMSDPAALASLRKLRPDVVVAFGTRRLGPEAIAVPRLAALNLHGGDPEGYRGLDSHLWAVYHDDASALVTALHHMDADLDTGDIVAIRPVPVPAKTPIHELRALNTRVCVDLVTEAFDAYAAGREPPRRRQATRGRYYSAMPTVLKDVVARKFERCLEQRPSAPSTISPKTS